MDGAGGPESPGAAVFPRAFRPGAQKGPPGREALGYTSWMMGRIMGLRLVRL